MHTRIYVNFLLLCLLLWLVGCTPTSESPSGQAVATPAPTTVVSATATLAPSPSPAASETPIPATARPIVPTPAATATTAADAVAGSAWCLDATTGTDKPASWESQPDTLTAAELKNYLTEMGVTRLCLPPQVDAPSLGVDWNAAATPPTADSGRRIRIEFQDSGAVNLIYSTYDFSVGAEYMTHATIADYEAVQAGTHPDLITTNGTPGFVHIGRDGYAGVIKAFVYPFADHYLALTTGLPYEAGVDDPDVLVAAMTEPPYPEEGALRVLDEMVASLMLTAGVPTESAVSAETGPRKEEIDSWSSMSPDGQWVVRGQWLGIYEKGEEGSDILAAYQMRLTVENTTAGTSWLVVDEQSGVGLGYEVPEVLHWSSRQPVAYVTHRGVPDGCGSQLINGSDLLRVDLGTGQVEELLPPITYALALSPDEKTAVTVDHRDMPGLVFHDLASGETRHLPLDVTYGEVGGFVWSPDGEQLLFAKATTPATCEANYDVVLANVDTLALNTVVRDDERGLIPAEWQEPGTPVLRGRDGQRWQLELDSGELEPAASQ